jgi:hypothetical protein
MKHNPQYIIHVLALFNTTFYFNHFPQTDSDVFDQYGRNSHL